MLYHKADLFSKWRESHFCQKKSLLQDRVGVWHIKLYEVGRITLFVSPSEALTIGQC